MKNKKANCFNSFGLVEQKKNNEMAICKVMPAARHRAGGGAYRALLRLDYFVLVRIMGKVFSV